MRTSRNAAAYSMPEAELQETIRRMCADLGLFHYHPRHSIGSEKGWPDSTIIHNGRMLCRELKSESGRPTPEQTQVGYLIRAQLVPPSWAIWRPSDLLSGRIAKELAMLAGVQGSLWETG